MTGATLRFDSVTFGRGIFRLDVDAVFPAGALTVILGPSGCGKTTLLDLAAGFLEPGTGRILEGERDVTQLPPEGRKFGVVFQDHALFPHMTVMNNILFGPLSRGVPRSEALRRAEELMILVRLDGYRNRRPASLSGGEKQRVALARALAINPDILILDEPFSALDAALRREMRGEVKRIQRKTGITAVLVTHDQEEALAIADHLVIMDQGCIVESGAPAELWQAPATLFSSEFLGRSSRLTVENIRKDSRGRIHLSTAAGDLTLPGDISCPEGPLALVVRSRDIVTGPDSALQGKVTEVEYAGGHWRITVLPPNARKHDVVMLETHGEEVPSPGDNIRFEPVASAVRLIPRD